MAGITIQTPEGPKTVAVPWKTILIVVVVIMGFMIANSTYYSVGAAEVGVVQRFGKYTDTTGPGLHFKWPWGIEEVTKVAIKKVEKEEFGFRTVEAGVTTRYARQSRELSMVSLMLTGDLNCAEVEWSVQYKVKQDPRAYLFNVRAPVTTLRDMSESIMREMVGERSVTEVLTSGRQEINVEVKQRLQETLDQYRAGINVTQVILQDVNPPAEVKASFNEVNQAQQEMEETINMAWKDYNMAIPRARGDGE